jgi:phosphodiesterase/alkaline phosphatase D-like protein
MLRLRSLLFLSLLVLAGGIVPLYAQSVAAGPWSGGVTSDAATVVARLFSRRLATLEVSASSDFAQFVSFGETSDRPGDQPEMSRFRAVGLTPSTRYFYRIRIGNQRDEQRTGSFTTLPLEDKPASFRFAFSSGATAGTDHGVYSEIKSVAPLFLIVAGNLHDAAFGATDREAFRAAYESVLSSFTQADLYRTVPLVYTWNAHDYGATGGATPARAAAHASFREYVPSHALADPASAEGAINRSFTVGRVRFLVLDVRTERGPAGTTLLGARQLAWLQSELLAAKARYPLTFVISPSAWLSPTPVGRDDWGRYPAERDTLSDWMVEQGITGVCFLTGDGDVLAADDGSNNRYGTRGGAGFPVLQAGPLNDKSTTGSGPWSHGPITPATGEGLFAVVDVLDAEGTISVSFRGLNQHGHEKMVKSFWVPAP